MSSTADVASTNRSCQVKPLRIYQIEIVLFRIYKVPALLVEARDEEAARSRARAIVDTANQGAEIGDDDYQVTIRLFVP